MKTSELTGAALDWAVAKCELMSGQNYTLSIDDDGIVKRVNYGGMYVEWSCEWEEAGPIIEREGICLYLYGNAEWNAHAGGKESTGPTPLIAAMRCHVASKLGDEVDIPEELTGVAA
jgi:hypothetical protein